MTFKNKSLRPSEHDEQCVVFDWVRMMANKDERYKLIYAVPNGGSRHAGEAARMKRAGVKAGVSDIAIDVPSSGYHGMKIEMKVKGNHVTACQDDYMNLAKKFGYKTVVCWSADEAIDEIKSYFAGSQEC